MRQRIRKKVHHLRQRPQPERVQSASFWVVLSAGAVFFLWLFLLLPIQLHFRSRPDQSPDQPSGFVRALFQRPETSDPPPQDIAATQSSPRVGGTRQYRRPLPSGPFFKVASPGSRSRQPDTYATPSTAATISPTPTSSGLLP